MKSSSSISIATTSPDGKSSQKTVTYVNPDATAEQLTTFAKELNGLTENHYEHTSRINTQTKEE
ncbi:MAG: hypothetical protein IJS69_04920 [Selenomonadaceae bacterium]|nr:hypothetical protein [Selenomonadaceae bacterium]